MSQTRQKVQEYRPSESAGNGRKAAFQVMQNGAILLCDTLYFTSYQAVVHSATQDSKYPHKTVFSAGLWLAVRTLAFAG